MAFVYHIHLPEDFGKYENGYIGYTTKTVDDRFKEHVQNAYADYSPGYHIHNAIIKYGEQLVVSTLVEGSAEYCLEIEHKLRPLPGIGWNIAAGGGRGMLGRKHSIATLDKMSKALKGKTRTEEYRREMSERSKGIPKSEDHARKIGDALRGRKRTEEQCIKMREALNATPWSLPRAVPANWIMAQDILDMVNEGVRHKDIMERCGHHKRSSALKHILDRVKSGWIPKEDPAWLQFKEQYLMEQTSEQT